MFTYQENLQYQRARESYQEIQRRKSELPEKDRQLFEQLEKVEIGRYDVPCSAVLMIAEVYDNNAINSFSTIFRLGFLKGQRAEKARQKKDYKGKSEKNCIA